jgi:undecaprenyl-diphosphatase
MDLYSALILGIVQGLTEFIPISSTAHMTLMAQILGVMDPAHPERFTAFMATVQLGTLAAVCAYFARDIANITLAFLRENVSKDRRAIREQSVNARLGWFVIIGTVPIVTVGLALKKIIEGPLTKEPLVIASGLVVIGIVLWIADKRSLQQRSMQDLTMRDALIVGLAQVLALIPGSSRSGTTMMAGLFRDMTRETAARFSFLLSIPAIFGAGVLEFLGHAKDLSWDNGGAQLAVATVAAAVSGYLSIAFLLTFLRTRSLNVFVIYRIIIGLVILGVLAGCSSAPTEDPAERTPTIENMQPPAERTLDTAAVTGVDSAVITHIVTMKTTAGTITIGLYGNDAPLTVKNFTQLIKKRYYQGIAFHRVAKNFVIQAGDPTTRSTNRAEWGTGGATASGEPLVEELDPQSPSGRAGYTLGTLAMARKQAPGTGTSQFFICLEGASGMPYQYTIFGRVMDGLDVVRTIAAGEIEPGPMGAEDGIPKKPVVIKNMTTTIVPSTK